MSSHWSSQLTWYGTPDPVKHREKSWLPTKLGKFSFPTEAIILLLHFLCGLHWSLWSWKVHHLRTSLQWSSAKSAKVPGSVGGAQAEGWNPWVEMNLLELLQHFDFWHQWWLETIWDDHEGLIYSKPCLRLFNEIDALRSTYRKCSWGRVRPSDCYFSGWCLAVLSEGACTSRYLTFLVVKLSFIRSIAYNTMQHHPAWSTMVLRPTTRCIDYPKSLGRCIFCSCREYPCRQRFIVSNWGNFRHVTFGFPKCIERPRN